MRRYWFELTDEHYKRFGCGDSGWQQQTGCHQQGTAMDEGQRHQKSPPRNQ